jgi:putative ABC transport system permease protein
VLGLYVAYQLSFDRHHEKHERIFRVVNEYRINDSADYASVTSTQLAPLLQEQYAEVEQAVRFQTMPAPRYLLRSDYEQAFYWERLLLTENNVFDIFDHEIIHGNPETALIDPSSMAVSESLARRYFGDANPIGETLYTDVSTYQIDLVFADLPDNSHMQYDALLSYNRLPQPDSDERLEQLWNISNYTYVLMPADYQPEQFRTISDSFFETNMAPLAQQMGVDGQVDFFLEPLADVHLTSTTIYDLPRGNIFFVYAFAAIAFFVLAVASINYMNLATARSTKRAREVRI